MDRPWVEELRIQNYGCVQDAEFRFTPLHALIGPNDSGKSTVLRALLTMNVVGVNGIAESRLRRALEGSTINKPIIIRLMTSWHPTFGEPIGAAFCCAAGQLSTTLGTRSSLLLKRSAADFLSTTPTLRAESLKQIAYPLQLLRLDPDALRIPCSLIQDGQPLRFQDEHGRGLPAIYDAIVTRDVQAFVELNAEIQQLFPDVKSITLLNPGNNQKAIGVKLHNGTLVPAELMSEGLLYYLAFAALRHTDPPAILLIEEPENGLHPARIAEVMRVLRKLSESMQIILATHSPLVVNELQPDEVTVVTRSREHGTKGVLLKDTPNFEERSKVYALGELWLSYADGQEEKALLQGGPRP